MTQSQLLSGHCSEQVGPMEGQGLETTPSTLSLCQNTLPVANLVVGQGLISLKIAFP